MRDIDHPGDYDPDKRMNGGTLMERVTDEHEQLVRKIIKLREFLDGDEVKTLAPNEQIRLRMQHSVMCGYRDILASRISAKFGDGPLPSIPVPPTRRA